MHLLIRFGWATQLVLPHEEGVKLMACLKGARVLESCGETPAVRPVKESDIRVSLLSEEQLAHYQIQNIMGTVIE